MLHLRTIIPDQDVTLRLYIQDPGVANQAEFLLQQFMIEFLLLCPRYVMFLQVSILIHCLILEPARINGVIHSPQVGLIEGIQHDDGTLYIVSGQVIVHTAGHTGGDEFLDLINCELKVILGQLQDEAF